MVLVGLLFAFVYPTRTFLDQRADTNKARSQLELLQSENARLAQETKKLKSDSEIERRGRAYGLVKPGEQSIRDHPRAADRATRSAARRNRRIQPRRLRPMERNVREPGIPARS